ncbi:hypothetical protein SAMN03159341_103233 [Paenibacillus sp. 1_12]|nr:hypothetical protein SAMN03159341_103233 [Paenibacillus sp. 1_12]
MVLLLCLLLPILFVTLTLIVCYWWSMRDYHTYESMGLKGKFAGRATDTHK